ncbi:MAG: hypothetical protein IK083_05535 [Abditibacteriota bacterium]|nr:hypothetical protein [Abditibacteriota bacterium]
MRSKIGLLWLLPALCALLLSSAAMADIQISTVDELLELCGQVVDEDVQLEPGIYDISGEEWTPIAEITEGHCIAGTEYSVIKGLPMNSSYGDYAGFVAVNNGSIQSVNVQVSYGSLASATFAGVIAGFNGANADIWGCHVYGESEQPVEIRSNSHCGYLGGICGYNQGAVIYCSVRDLTLSAGAGTSAGGITGKTLGTVADSTVFHTALTGTSQYSILGGITAELEGPEDEVPAFAESNNVLYCDLTGKASAMGGIAGTVNNGEISFSRVNYVGFSHYAQDSCYIGGLAGSVDGDNSRLSNSYYADMNTTDMVYAPNDYAGGIVGVYSVYVTDPVFVKCYYATDFCDASLYGAYFGDYSDQQFESCAGVTKMEMTSDGWGMDNLDESFYGPWRNVGPDCYPVTKEEIPVRFARLHRGDDYLPLDGYRLLYEGIDVANIGLVADDFEFDPAGFTIQNTDPFDEMQIEVDFITVNGIAMTDPFLAGEFDEICFSAEVDNAFCRDCLAPNTFYAMDVYTSGKGYYTAESLIPLREAIDEALMALEEAYLSVDPNWGQELIDNMFSAIAALEVRDYDVMFICDGGTVTIDGGDPDETWVVTSPMDEVFLVKAEAGEGRRFLYWEDTAGNILSEDPEFEYVISRETIVTAVTAPANSFNFVYKDMYGKTYRTDAVTDFSQLAYPVAAGQGGLRTGYKVKEWQNDYPGDLPASGAVTRDVTFTAMLKKADSSYTVNSCILFGGDVWLDETVTKKTAQVFTRVAPEFMEDTEFTCWIDADTGEIISCDPALSISVYSDLNLAAIYEGPSFISTCVNLWEPIVEGGKIAFTGQTVMGDDFGDEVMHGVLLLKSDEPVGEILFDTPGVIVGKSSGYSAYTNTYIINKKNVQSGDTWYGRAFIVYNDDIGERKVVFSDIKGATMP